VFFLFLFYLFCGVIKLEYICTRFITTGENRVCSKAFTIIHFIMDLLKYVQDEFIEKKDFPDFSSGDTITVYYEIKEGQKTRIQFFRGTVLQIKGSGMSKTFTIRKMSGTVGVERIFPINMPSIQKIEVNKRGDVRRSRIYYFRNLTGKKARIKDQVKK
jgi:large subunit ribosomal protein L19